MAHENALDLPDVVVVHDIAAGADAEPAPPPPLETAGLFATLFMTFMNGVLAVGATRPLLQTDIDRLPSADTVAAVFPGFSAAWTECQSTSASPSLLWAIVRTFWRRCAAAGVGQFLSNAFALSIPFLVKDFVEFLMADRDNAARGLADVAGIFVANLLSSICQNNSFYHVVRCAGMVREAVMAAIYEKSLRLSATSRMATSTGQTVNLMSADASRVYDAVIYVHFLWTAPLTIIAVAVTLLYYYGVAAAAGIAVLALLVPLQMQFTWLAATLRRAMLKSTDHRIMFTTELLSGIRTVKQYAWEGHAAKRVAALRDAELVSLQTMQFVNLLSTSLVTVWPCIVSSVIFIVLVRLGNPFTFVAVFFVLALLVSIRFPISLLQKAIQTGVDGMVSLNRISVFLSLAEICPYVTHDDPRFPIGAVVLESCNFRWDQAVVLRNVSLSVGPGALVAVVGPVATGKSSLLNAILGEMHLESGSVTVNGSVAYSSQTSWIRNRTVKDNIVFGAKFDQVKYSSVLAASALLPDLAVLPGGDQTEIGEQGINLSGGQKARIMFARALYSARDITLLDDPFAAVDMVTGDVMFRQGVKGVLSRSTRIVTLNSHMHFLHDVDLIVVMETTTDDSSSSIASVFDNYNDFLSSYPALATEDNASQRGSDSAAVAIAESNGNAAPSSTVQTVLVAAEQQQIGHVRQEVYLAYFAACFFGFGRSAVFVMMVLFGVGQAARVLTDYWAIEWAQSENPDTSYWLSTQAAWAGASVLVVVWRSQVFNNLCIRGSRTLHDSIFHRMLRAPINTFFDVTPLGRIVNRFSKDMDQIDVLLSDCTGQLFLYSMTLIFAVLLACIASYWIIVPLVPLLYLFYRVQLYFRSTSRQIKRIEGAARSPIFSLFEETLSGLPSIRAYRRQPRFIHDVAQAIDEHSKVQLATQMVGRWLAARLDIMSIFLITLVALAVFVFRYSMNVPLGILALVQVMQLTGLLQWTVRVSIDVENNMTAVERVNEYGAVAPEGPEDHMAADPGPDWPDKGCITFDNLCARYRPELPLVLKGISVTINATEKVGICGRTGSGKSSLAQCLLRMIERDRSQGRGISIDGVPIDSVPLQTLRERISIIPQDAVLFSGTVRENLDPFRLCADTDVWNALEQVFLADSIRRLPRQLQEVVAERGANFSHGQRQLICIARAFLRNSKIILCDEATSGIDSETDSLIQKAIRELFRTKTVLTIAHRLETIADCDRIMVISDGHVKEFDTPINLLGGLDTIAGDVPGSDLRQCYDRYDNWIPTRDGFADWPDGIVQVS